MKSRYSHRRIVATVIGTLLVTDAFGVSAASSEVEVDEGGNINQVQNNDDESLLSSSTTFLGYKFGPTEQQSGSPTKPWSILKELFPDTLQSLSDVWESHPAYLPGSLTSNSMQDTNLRTLISEDKSEKTTTNDNNRFSSLFQVDDSLTVLNNPELVHGKDYIILKYLMQDGEEWNGQLPYSSIPLQDIPMLIQQKEFSLVINDLHKRWISIKNFARSLETEVMSSSVSCNLYVTPPKSARAFESHLDWMDVIVLQVVGTKDWTVWTDPLISLVPPDEKRKPDMKTEIQSTKYLQENVRLYPGDALYIPRGHLHNATTPSDSDSLSMHLTFGIEYFFETTIEALLHYAVSIFVASNKQDPSISDGGICGDTSHPSGLTYEVLLHYGISEIIRRTNCHGFGEKQEPKREPYNDAICSLRKSVPLHPQIQQIKGRSDKVIEQMYVDGVKAIPAQVSLVNTLSFIASVGADSSGQGNNNKSSEKSLGAVNYRYPGMSKDTYFSFRDDDECIKDIMHSSSSSNVSQQILFQKFAQSFMEFAIDNIMFYDVKRKLETEVLRSRTHRWRNEDQILLNMFGSL